MYSLCGHGSMIADGVRMRAYREALRRAVQPASVVVDIGTGTGIFALLACQFGARRVYAIEPDHAIQVAREIAVANGYAERIEFIQNLSTQITLPERADVIVSDLRGVLPWFQQHLPSIADARQRFLATGGILIPESDTLWAAVVEAPDLYSRHLNPWDGDSYGINLQPARDFLINTWRKARINPEQLLVEPRSWATLNYGSVETTNPRAEITWTVARAGIAHGLSAWFDCALAPGVGFSNAPGAPELIYGNAFFPWSTPVCLAAGDTVTVTLRADLVGEDYLWSWETSALDQGQPERIKAHFKQSSFLGVPLGTARLRKRAANYVPVLNRDGQINQLVLGLMDGKTPLDEIARRVASELPTCFPQWQDALTKVGELSEKFSH